MERCPLSLACSPARNWDYQSHQMNELRRLDMFRSMHIFLLLFLFQTSSTQNSKHRPNAPSTKWNVKKLRKRISANSPQCNDVCYVYRNVRKCYTQFFFLPFVRLFHAVSIRPMQYRETQSRIIDVAINGANRFVVIIWLFNQHTSQL